MECSATLVTLPPSEESAQILRSTVWLLKCLLVLDLSYLLSGVSINVLTHSHTLPDKDLVFLGVLLGLFAAMSAMCNR